jgi:hypothetical protein
VAEPDTLEPVSPTDGNVVTAIATHGPRIITFKVTDFAAGHLKEHLPIGLIHADDFIMDVVDLNEKRAVSAFRELQGPDKKILRGS